MKPGSSRQYFLPIFSNANILKIKIKKDNTSLLIPVDF